MRKAPTVFFEKDVNLSVALCLRDYLEAAGIPTVPTRTQDKLLYDPAGHYRGRKRRWIGCPVGDSPGSAGQSVCQHPHEFLSPTAVQRRAGVVCPFRSGIRAGSVMYSNAGASARPRKQTPPASGRLQHFPAGPTGNPGGSGRGRFPVKPGGSGSSCDRRLSAAVGIRSVSRAQFLRLRNRKPASPRCACTGGLCCLPCGTESNTQFNICQLLCSSAVARRQA